MRTGGTGAGLREAANEASLPEVDGKKIGCVGNSGGGTLTAYIAALDPRVAVAAICCYITTLPRRMGNRIEADPDADPEQDIFGFVGEGIDHAGLLALRAPRPTLLGTARFDFFPIEGARESFAEAQHLFAVAGPARNVERAEAAERHGKGRAWCFSPHPERTEGLQGMVHRSNRMYIFGSAASWCGNRHLRPPGIQTFLDE